MFNYGKGKKARKRYMHLVLLPRLFQFWMNKMVPSSKKEKKEKKNPIFMRNVEAGKNVLRRQNELKNTRI